MWALRTLIYLYLVTGLFFGIARFGWGASVAAMAEPEVRPFIAGMTAAAVDGAIRVADWAPTLYLEVIQGGGDFFEWMLYA